MCELRACKNNDLMSQPQLNVSTIVVGWVSQRRNPSHLVTTQALTT